MKILDMIFLVLNYDLVKKNPKYATFKKYYADYFELKMVTTNIKLFLK